MTSPLFPNINVMQSGNTSFCEVFLKPTSNSFIRPLNKVRIRGPTYFVEPFQTIKVESLRIDCFRGLPSVELGLAINPDKSAPDFVLTYGMIWNYRATGNFLSDQPIQSATTLELQKDQKILAGPPADFYLPPFVRRILRDFLLEQGVLQPRVAVISPDRKNYDLCFSLESLGRPPQSEHRQLLEAFSWFLPAHYSLAIVSENDIGAFVDL